MMVTAAVHVRKAGSAAESAAALLLYRLDDADVCALAIIQRDVFLHRVAAMIVAELLPMARDAALRPSGVQGS